jgi:hypothetical protein
MLCVADRTEDFLFCRNSGVLSDVYGAPQRVHLRRVAGTYAE